MSQMVDVVLAQNKSNTDRRVDHAWSYFAFSLILAFGAMLLDFVILGTYQNQGDTSSYVASVEFYDTGSLDTLRYGDRDMNEFRLLKPVYGIIGSLLTPIISPHQTILLLNLIFFYGTVTILFLILFALGFTPLNSAIGTAWFSFGYPMLKYGFSLITDISGYFFIALTSYLALIGFKKKKLHWMLWAGTASAFGVLSKESGSLGLLFIIGATIIDFKRLGWRFAATSIALAGGTFALIYFPIQALIMQRIGYSFFDFFNKTQHAYYGDYPAHLFYPLIHGATFHILWLYAAIGTIFWIKDKKDPLWIGAWIVGLPTVFWLMYVTRYAFVYFIAVIPFALYGLDQISTLFDLRQSARGKKLIIGLAVIPCIINILLLCGAKSGTYLNFLLK